VAVLGRIVAVNCPVCRRAFIGAGLFGVVWRSAPCSRLCVFAGRPVKRASAGSTTAPVFRHRPATALTDTIRDQGSGGAWRCGRNRREGARWPRSSASVPVLPFAAPCDPRSLGTARALVHGDDGGSLCSAAGDERTMRNCRRLRLERRAGARPNIRVDRPGVTPPVYTSKPPIILSAANKDAGAARQRAVTGSGRQHAAGALQRRHHRRGGRWRVSPRSRPGEQGAQGHQ